MNYLGPVSPSLIKGRTKWSVKTRAICPCSFFASSSVISLHVLQKLQGTTRALTWKMLYMSVFNDVTSKLTVRGSLVLWQLMTSMLTNRKNCVRLTLPLVEDYVGTDWNIVHSRNRCITLIEVYVLSH